MRYSAVVLLILLAAGCTTPSDAPRYHFAKDSLNSFWRAAAIGKDDVLADLAWDDGRAAVVAAQKYGIKTYAYPDDVVGFFKAKVLARNSGVSEKVSVEFPGPRMSVVMTSVVFYAPSPLYGLVDLASLIKAGSKSGKIISTQRIRITGVELDFLGESEGLSIYRWGPPLGVRDTVPPPKDVFYPLPPKPAAPDKPAAK